ncbi:hypothetical protein IEO21_03026 [Rhodonia placenta]|uniref:BTB domain-containing protein n=1 Tax=Rhodonia placenta TaxID=104341 RepID=A0A8H7U4M5_9APHY|nr:hypothetical protein IEO21_03026 [Postia placenta]
MASVKPDVQLYSSGINPNAWVKDTEFWSQDGNVVLFAQGRGFRVRHDNLMFQSEILEDMYNSAFLATAAYIEGCPVVHLQGTSWEVWSLLAMILHKKEPLRSDIVCGAVRLAHKYNISKLLKAGLKRLKSFFCEDLATWRSVFSKMHSGLILVRVCDAIAVVHVAYLTNTPSLLPTALFVCTLLPVSTLIDTTTALSEHEKLRPDLLIKCLEAKAFYARDAVVVAARLFSLWCTHKPTARSCGCQSFIAGWYDIGVTRLMDVERRIETTKYVDSQYTAFGGWKEHITEWMDNRMPSESIPVPCRECGTELLAKENEECCRAWQELPERFGLSEALPNWAYELGGRRGVDYSFTWLHRA